jgi:hypothetical protein
MFVYQASRRYLVLMLVCALAVGAIVQVFASRVAPIYGGKALVQLGEVSGKTLTNPEAVVAGFDAPSFRRRVLQAMDSAATSDPRSVGLISGSLSGRPGLSDVINVSVRATDEKQVRQAIDAVIRVLNQKQEARREQLVADIRMQLAVLDGYLASLTKIQESLSAQAKTTPADTAPLGALLLLEMTARNGEQQASAQASRVLLQQRLAPDQTYPTRLVDDDFPISLVAGPGQPWRTTLVAVAITLLGFMLFALVAGRKTAGQN